MNEQHFIQCIKNGADLYWRSLGRCRGIECHNDGDIEYVMSSTRDGIERIFDVQFAPDAEERRIQEMIDGMQNGSLPDNILIIPGVRPGDLTDRLAAKGFRIDESGLCMALSLECWQKGTRDTGSIEVVRMSSPEMLTTWRRIVSVALFGCELLSCEQVSDLFALNCTQFYLALDGGVPASTAMTIRHGDTATLEMVATLPEHRRRGLGTAIIREALHHLRQDGARIVSLRAEPDGIHLYREVGFKEYCRRIVAVHAPGAGSTSAE